MTSAKAPYCYYDLSNPVHSDFCSKEFGQAIDSALKLETATWDYQTYWHKSYQNSLNIFKSSSKLYVVGDFIYRKTNNFKNNRELAKNFDYIKNQIAINFENEVVYSTIHNVIDIIDDCLIIRVLEIDTTSIPTQHKILPLSLCFVETWGVASNKYIEFSLTVIA